jgi:ketosteroid isomerase-like protein
MSASSVVRDVYAAFARGETDAALRLYADDVTITQAPRTPWAGRYLGHAGFRAFAAKLFGAVARLEIVETEFVGEGERVVVLETLRLWKGDRALQVEALEVFTVRDERVRAVEVWYRDPQAVIDWVSAA